MVINAAQVTENVEKIHNKEFKVTLMSKKTVSVENEKNLVLYTFQCYIFKLFYKINLKGNFFLVVKLY